MRIDPFLAFLLAVTTSAAIAEEAAPKEPTVSSTAVRQITPELRAAVAKLEMPGVKINLDEWSVDLDAKICLEEGLLELIACTVNSKEHESIVTIEGRPSHAHTALLLLGAKPGKPALMELAGPEMNTFRHFPPSGGPVDVFLVLKDAAGKEVEKPISEFIIKADRDGPAEKGEPGKKKQNFPTHTFLFAGSVLEDNGEGARQYSCDVTGNVISIATFGDELLCQPEITDSSNEFLMWQIDGEKLPELDSKVILRLRPQLAQSKGVK